jgi:hypothetical protein
MGKKQVLLLKRESVGGNLFRPFLFSLLLYMHSIEPEEVVACPEPEGA